MKVEIINLAELRHAEYNPRTLSKEDFEQIKTSVKKFGFVEPLVVNSHPDRKGIIVGGNQRFEVAKAMGMTEVPVVFISIDDIKKEQELNLRLNRNHGDWNWDELANQFEIDFLKEVGFEDWEIEGVGKMDVDKFFGDEDKAKSDKDKTITCPSCGENFVLN